jgi:hypothetical protein
MNWIKKHFSKRAREGSARTIPERPPDWNLTLDDLMAEMKAGKRKSVGNPQAEWARQYERSLIPECTRFPRKGDLYESKCDQTVDYLTDWRAPFTGGGKAVLFKGERIWVDNDPLDEKPLGAYALPVEYERLESRMVPQEERESPKYNGFYFHFKTVDLNKNFALIQTGFDGRG